MTPPPTHIVTVRCQATKSVHLYQPFTLAYAEALLAAYVACGWTGEIEERS